MPVTGYLGTGANTDFFWLFEIPKFESTHLFTFWVSDRLNMSFAEFEVVVDYLHKDVGGALLVWMLIAGHISAALAYHFVLKDKVPQASAWHLMLVFKFRAILITTFRR